jgi:hypothetical protein
MTLKGRVFNPGAASDGAIGGAFIAASRHEDIVVGLSPFGLAALLLCGRVSSSLMISW